MARRNIPVSQKEDLIRDWELGLYSNIARLAIAHEVSYNTASSIVKASKSIKGSREHELRNVVDATKEYVKNPSPENSTALEKAYVDNPIRNLFDFEAIKSHSNGLVSLELMDEIEEQLTKSTIVLIQARANQNVRENSKKIFNKDAGIITVPLDSGDLKDYIDISDKTLVALGYAPRHAPKSGDVNILNQQSGVLSEEDKSIISYYDDISEAVS